MTDDVLVTMVIGLDLHDLSCNFDIWSQIDTMAYKTYILKIPENGCDFQPLTLKPKPNFKYYQNDVPWSTDNANICFHVVW